MLKSLTENYTSKYVSNKIYGLTFWLFQRKSLINVSKNLSTKASQNFAIRNCWENLSISLVNIIKYKNNVITIRRTLQIMFY